MFTSTKWEDCKCRRPLREDSLLYCIELEFLEWGHLVLECICSFGEGDVKPSMNFLYGKLRKAKEKIKVVLKNSENAYLLDIIDSKANYRLDTPLHKTTYLLNSFYCHQDPQIAKEGDLIDAMCTCVEMFFLDDINKQTKILMTDLAKYTNKKGVFGRVMTQKAYNNNNSTYDPNNNN
ncbi:hypothetical protein ACOSP7_016281 [Xanthoceras sorbifolium]